MPWAGICAIAAAAAIVGSIFSLAWLPGAIVMSVVSWRLCQCGIAVRPDGVQVRNFWPRARFVSWDDIDSFAVTPVNRAHGRVMMFGTLIRKDGTHMPTYGISAVARNPRRADVVVARLNAILSAHHSSGFRR
jgi:hypothetical protein